MVVTMEEEGEEEMVEVEEEEGEKKRMRRGDIGNTITIVIQNLAAVETRSIPIPITCTMEEISLPPGDLRTGCPLLPPNHLVPGDLVGV